MSKPHPVPQTLHPVTSALCWHRSLQCDAKAIGIALLLLAVGCSEQRSTQVELNMTVQPTNRPGVYTVSGSTNLPDESQIIVQGIRPLTVSGQLISTNETPHYAILDRQMTKTSQGKWQTTLKLWQAAPDGQYQEAWQLSQAQLSRLNPSAEVAFVAVIDPANRARVLQQQLEKQGKKLEGANVRFTPDGQWYLQAKQTLAVTLPTGKTTPVGVSTNDSTGDWGNRTFINSTEASLPASQLLTPKDKQTTAPLDASQRLR